MWSAKRTRLSPCRRTAFSNAFREAVLVVDRNSTATTATELLAALTVWQRGWEDQLRVVAEERDACLAAGMNGHLSKPIEPAVLFDTLAQLRRSARPTVPFGSRPPAAPETLPVVEGLDTRDGLARVARAAQEDMGRVPFVSEEQRQARRAELERDLRRAEALGGLGLIA